MADTTEYHLRELSTARDPSSAGYAMPTIAGRHKTILDIGCGMGQTLLAAELAPDVSAYGVDPDATAVEAGRGLVPANIHLAVGVAESLPFADGMFDLVICRVALPYTRVTVALGEISRVLKPGGDFWLVLHPRGMYLKRAGRALRQGKWKDLIYCGFILGNGALCNRTGRQIVIRGRTETFQSERGIRRLLARAGLTCTAVRCGASFIVEGRKT